MSSDPNSALEEKENAMRSSFASLTQKLSGRARMSLESERTGEGLKEQAKRESFAYREHGKVVLHCIDAFSKLSTHTHRLLEVTYIAGKLRQTRQLRKAGFKTTKASCLSFRVVDLIGFGSFVLSTRSQVFKDDSAAATASRTKFHLTTVTLAID